jgi:hypothetical protein
VLEEAFR